MPAMKSGPLQQSGPTRKTLIPAFSLGLVLMLYALATGVWHFLDRSPVEFDQSMYWVRSMLFYHQLQALDFAALAGDFWAGMEPLAPMQPVRPVLIPLMSATGYLVLGPSRGAAVLTVAGLTVVLLIFCYLIGREWMGQRVGVLAALFALTTPLIAILSRQYYLEVPLAAMAAATVYFVVRRDAFANPWTSIAIGFLVGMGMLTRENYLLFVAGPIAGRLAVGVWRGVAEGERRPSGRALAGLAVGAVLALSLALPFYLPKVQEASVFASNVWGSAKTAQDHGIDQASLLDRWSAYSYFFIRMGATVPYFALLVISSAVLLLRKRPSSIAGDSGRGTEVLVIVVLWILVPYAVGATSTAVDLRYLTPALPAFALLLSGSLFQATRGRLQPVVLFLVAGYSVVQFYCVSFAPGSPRVDPFTPWAEVGAPVSGIFGDRIKPGKYMSHVEALAAPRMEDWKVDEIVYSLDELRRGKEIGHAIVFVVPYTADMNTGSFVSSAFFRELPLSIMGPAGKTVKTMRWEMQHSHFLVVKDRAYGPSDLVELMKGLDSLPFQPTDRRFSLPDGSTAIIYERAR